MGRAGLRVFVVLFLLVLPWRGFCQETPAASWSLEPFLSAGWVYELTDYAHGFTGMGLVGRYTPGAWSALGRYEIQDYVFSYFGISQQTVDEILSGQPATGPFLPRLDVRERKQEGEIMIGLSPLQGSFSIYAGARRLSLDNDFSSMESLGPSLRAEGGMQTGLGLLALRLDGVLYPHVTVQNHRLDAFVLPVGAQTTSFYGVPRSGAGWSVGLSPFQGAWRRISFGYEGSVLVLQYGYRYYHGLTISATF